MSDGENRFTVAVLIRKTSQWPEALRTGRALRESGATVSLFWLGYAPMSIEYPLPDDPGFKCYADSFQAGMACIAINEIAELLKRCDLVIPI